MFELKVEVNGKIVDLSNLEKYDTQSIRNIGPGIFHFLYKNKSYRCKIEKLDSASGKCELSINDIDYSCQIISPLNQTIKSLNLTSRNKAISKNLTAVMPGMVLDVLVENGQTIEEGEPLMILEAMKMENVLKSGYAGIVQKIHCEKQDAVDKGQILIEIV